MARTTAIVVTFNRLDLLRPLLDSILGQSVPFAHIFFVDNGSSDGTVDFVRKQPGVNLLASDQNRGHAAGVNSGLQAALKDPLTDTIALINNDVILEKTWHEKAVQALSSSKIYGSCATCLLKKENPIFVDTAGICWAQPGLAENHLTGQTAPSPESPPQEVFGACAAAALYRREFLEDVGLFDESLFAYQEDVDLALRGHLKGWSCVFAPEARGIHLGFGTNRSFPLGGSYADYFNARNRLYVLVKSLPAMEWKKHWKLIVGTHISLLLRSIPERHGLAVACGAVHGILRLGQAVRARRRM